MHTPQSSNSAGRDDGQRTSEEQESLRKLLELCPLPSLLVDPATAKIVLANEAARQVDLPALLGSSSAACGPIYHVRSEAIDSARFLAYLLREAKHPEGVEASWQTAQRQNIYRVFARSDSPTRGSACVTVLTFVDVWPQKMAEAELRQALLAREELFSIASHELKDPIFALQLSLQYLHHTVEKQQVAPATFRHYLDIGIRQANRLSRLIENLLDVSRIAQGQLQLDLEPVDLAQLAEEMVEQFKPKASSLGIDLCLEKKEPAQGIFDRFKMEQIINNLLSNALKYGSGKPVTIRVSSRGEEVFLEVQDQGIGIAAQDQERIFDRFERASSGHKKESLGLGLFITRSLIQAHGGTITVNSNFGQGSTFRVTLPRCPKEEEQGGTP